MWEFIITGCGTSHGNPPWGYPRFWSSDPRDHRRRSGAVLKGPQGQIILFDCGPDLAHQCMDPYKNWDHSEYPTQCITRCDGLLLTHTHADHCHGINELRHINRLMNGASIPIYGHTEHLAELRRSFPYCFGETTASYRMGNPLLETHDISPNQTFCCAGLTIQAIPLSHGPAGLVHGYRIGEFAYLTDCKSLIPSGTKNCKTLIY